MSNPQIMCLPKNTHLLRRKGFEIVGSSFRQPIKTYFIAISSASVPQTLRHLTVTGQSELAKTFSLFK